MPGSGLRIAVTGAGGMLGTALIAHLAPSHRVFAAGRSVGLEIPGVHWHAFDLLDERELDRWLDAARPDAVVHCAAIVNVDACEKSPAAATALHVGSTASLANQLSARGSQLVYVSTDSVFDGRKPDPYLEEDPVAPPNNYASTKLAGERYALSAGGAVLRTNIFGWSRTERISFAEWVLKGLVERTPLTMFHDVRYTPIHVGHLAEVVEEVVVRRMSGLFHATGGTVLSKFEFAQRLAATFGLPDDNLRPISVDDAGLTASRPKNMALDNSRLAAALGHALAGADAGVALMRRQYDDGSLSRFKSRPIGPNYRFWETS